jgi:DDE domain
MRRGPARVPVPRSGFAGFRFPPDVIMIAVRWYLRYGLSYRDIEELLVERGVAVDHVTIYCWVQRFTPLLIDATRPCRHAPGDRWFVDETYIKVAGRWGYLYRAIDQFGQVIDVLVAEKRPRIRACLTSCCPPATSPSNTERMKLSTVSTRPGGICSRTHSFRRQRFKMSVRSRSQGGALSWTNDLDLGEDRRSVGRRWAWFDPVAKSRVGGC